MTNKKRIELHEELCTLLGNRNVYFQPPTSIKIDYPAIIYKLDDIRNNKADNRNYILSKNYTITLIDKNPESDVIDKLMTLPFAKYDRGFVTDNLNHSVFSIFY